MPSDQNKVKHQNYFEIFFLLWECFRQIYFEGGGVTHQNNFQPEIILVMVRVYKIYTSNMLDFWNYFEKIFWRVTPPEIISLR